MIKTHTLFGFALSLILSAVLCACSGNQLPGTPGILGINSTKISIPAHCNVSWQFEASGGIGQPYAYFVQTPPGSIAEWTGLYTAGGAGQTVLAFTDLAGNNGTAAVTNYSNLTNDVITAAAEDALGNTYIAGAFTRVCPYLTPNVVFTLAATGAPDLNANIGLGFDGPVLAAAALNNGDIVVGGNFQHYNGIPLPTNNLVLLDAGANFIKTFSAGTGPNGPVNALAVDAANNIYVGGNFTTFNGLSGYQYLVKLNSSGALDPIFTQGQPNGAVNALALDTSNNLFAVGAFTSYGVMTVYNIAKISAASGALDTAFASGQSSNPSSAPLTVAVDNLGDVYVGGNFTTFNGTGVGSIARLNYSGVPDTATFNSNIGTGFSGAVNALAADATGVYATGNFASFNGTSASGFMRLTTTGLTVGGFSVGSGLAATATVGGYAILLDGLGNVYVAGNFVSYQGAPAGGIIGVNIVTGSVSTTYLPALGLTGPAASVPKANVLAQTTNGDIFIGGSFNGYQGQAANHLAAFDVNWNAVPAFSSGGGIDPGVSTSVVNALAVDSANNLYVGGMFENYDGNAVNNLAYVTGASNPSPGALVGTFNSGIGYNGVNGVTALALDNLAPSHLYIGGNFSTYDGTATDTLVQVMAGTGVLVSAFTTALGHTLTTAPSSIIVNDTTYDIYVGGTGFTVGPLAELGPTGAPVAGFDTGGTWFTAGDSVSSLAFDASANIFVGGSFSKFRGTVYNNILKIGPTGTADPSFNTGFSGFNGAVTSLFVDATDTSLLTAGPFSLYYGGGAPSFGKLDMPTGALDSTFATTSNVEINLPAGVYFNHVYQSHNNTALLLTSGGGTAQYAGAYFQYSLLVDETYATMVPQ